MARLRGVAALVATSRIYVRIHHASRRGRRRWPPALVIGTVRPGVWRAWPPEPAARDPGPGMPLSATVVEPGMALTFAVTWDYRCPFARIAHDARARRPRGRRRLGRHLRPVLLGQVHVAEGETDIWERPEDDSGLLALQAGVVVRDQSPTQFLAVHRALFDARHVHGAQARRAEAVRAALVASGVDADAVLAEIADGAPLETVRKEHEAAAPATTCGACPPSSWADRGRLRPPHAPTPDGDGELARTHGRAHRRPGRRMARAQRVQAHHHPPLSHRSCRRAPLPVPAPCRLVA